MDMMPAGIQAVMKWLPFYYALFCPIASFMERLRGAENRSGPRDSNRLALDNVGNRTLHVEAQAGTLSSSQRLRE